MTKFRHAAAVLASTTVALLLAGTTVATAAPTRPHPAITDPSGDGRAPIGGNVAAADIRSADVAISGGKVTFTITTGASARTGSGTTYDHGAPYSFMGTFRNPNGQLLGIHASLNPGGVGVLESAPGEFGADQYARGATTSTNGVTTVSFSVAQINRNAPDFSQGIRPSTIVLVSAFSSVSTILGRAEDRADGGDFTLGG